MNTNRHNAPHIQDQTSWLDKLSKLLSLTSANVQLAKDYLLNDEAGDELLQQAQLQILPQLSWPEREPISTLFAALTAGDRERACRTVRYLWAVGQSSAENALRCLYKVAFTRGKGNSDEIADRRVVWDELLGLPAAAALEGQAVVYHYIGNKRIASWLQELAQTQPDVLVQAQTLCPAGETMMPAFLAGILLQNARAGQDPRPGLLARVFGVKSEPVRWTENQVDILLRGVMDYLKHGRAGITASDCRQLEQYIQSGRPADPVPRLSVGTGWDVQPQNVLKVHIGADSDRLSRLALAAFEGQAADSRLRCAFKVLSGLRPGNVLDELKDALGFEEIVRQAAVLKQCVPGGGVVLLLYMGGRGYASQKEAIRLAQLCSGEMEQALKLANDDQYAGLCSLLPEDSDLYLEWKRKKQDRAAAMQDRIIRQFRNALGTGGAPGADGDAMEAYLTDQGSMAGSAARLAPFADRQMRMYDARSILQAYHKSMGWDRFFCRSMVALALVNQGWIVNGLPDQYEKFANALNTFGMPPHEILDVLGAMYAGSYPGEQENIRKAGDTVCARSGVGELAIAAREGCSFARSAAVKGLGAVPAGADDAPKAREVLLDCANETAKMVQKELLEAYCGHPEWKEDYAALLAGKKQGARIMAARALAEVGGPEAVPILNAALEKEKSAKAADAIREALAALGAAREGKQEEKPQDAAELAAQILKGGKKRKVQWLLDKPLPTVHCTGPDRAPAGEDRMAAILVCYADLGRIGRSPAAEQLAQGLDAAELAAYACEVWDHWIEAGAQSKTKWVLAFAARCGGEAMTPRLTQAVKTWPEHARGAIACDGVQALAISPDPAALMTVDAISRKFKFRQVKTAAGQALANAARELGISAEELADRIVPTLGFGPDGTQVFDYGPRQFTVRLTAALELEITNDAGKQLKNLPAPGKADDPEKAGAASAAFKNLKKQIKTTVSAQKGRLESALSVQRCWTPEAWQALFVNNPIMHRFAISLIWGVYTDGRLGDTFRYLEDGSFTTADEEEYTLPAEDAGARIGLVHPIELDQEALSAWRQQLEDYEITPAIDQLDRPVYRLQPDQAGHTALERFGGKKISDLSLTGKLLGMGWYRGSVQDAGGFYSFYREDQAVGLSVQLNFSGAFVGSGESETVTVYDAVFYRAGTVEHGSYVYDEPKKEDILPLDQVPARYYSEVVYQLEKATASSTETDPFWKATR